MDVQLLTAGRAPGTFDEARLLEKVERDEASGCWLWVAALSRTGYGCFRYQGRSQQAHRVSYMLFVGQLRADQVVDHLCRNRRCVNPAHLEAVTQRENLLRGRTVTSRNASRTGCPRGHAFDSSNTYVDPSNGARKSRACRKQQRRQHFLRTGA